MNLEAIMRDVARLHKLRPIEKVREMEREMGLS